MSAPLVFVIDDEQHNADLVSRTLPTCDVRTFGDGEAALKTASESPPDGVVVDYRMPGLNGVQVVQELRRTGCDCAVLMVTAYPDLDEVVFAQQANLVYRIIPKPFEPAYLQTQMLVALAEKHLQTQEALAEAVLQTWTELRDASQVGETAAAVGLTLKAARVEPPGTEPGSIEVQCDIIGHWRGVVSVSVTPNMAVKLCGVLPIEKQCRSLNEACQTALGQWVSAVGERLGGILLPTYSLSTTQMSENASQDRSSLQLVDEVLLTSPAGHVRWTLSKKRMSLTL